MEQQETANNIIVEYWGQLLRSGCRNLRCHIVQEDLQMEDVNPIVIYYDNLSNIQLPKNLVSHAPTKHIEVHYHFSRVWVLLGEVELKHVPTNRQVADIFTKPLGLDKLRHFSSMLGL